MTIHTNGLIEKEHNIIIIYQNSFFFSKHKKLLSFINALNLSAKAEKMLSWTSSTILVDTWCFFKVYKMVTSYRRLTDVKKTPCVYWDEQKKIIYWEIEQDWFCYGVLRDTRNYFLKITYYIASSKHWFRFVKYE